MRGNTGAADVTRVSPPSPFWPATVPHAMGTLPESLGAALRQSAARRPDHTALVFYGTEIRFSELLVQVDRLAAFLQFRCGVSKGDRVLLDMQNSPQFVVAFHAIVRAGAAVVPVNPMNVASELPFLCADSGATVALIGAELLDRFADLIPYPLRHIIVTAYGDAIPDPCPFRLPPVLTASRLPSTLPMGTVRWRDALAESQPPLPDDCNRDDICVMPYTSGTTGEPKACVHSHAAVLFTAAAQAAWYGYDDSTVVTGFMPLFHVAGMQVSMNAGIVAGVTVVLMTRWDRDLIPALFPRYRVTVWSAAPTMVVDALAAQGFDDRTFATLRVLTGGGATMPAAVVEHLYRRWGLRFVEGYGLSETIAATHLNPPDRPKPQCLGIPIQETTARIVDPDTLEELPPGATGEIIIAGPQVMRGYWNRPKANAEVFVGRDGLRFLRTGDLGYMDDEGYFFIVDRLKRMINVSGYKVWPSECESVLYRHPAVQECCVVSSPDPYRGETVKAFIVLRSGATLDADGLITWARGAMAAYKVPRSVAFVGSLPRTGSSKIDWRALQTAEWAANRP